MYYLIEGELVDTYGGDYTYRDLWYEIDGEDVTFTEHYYGAKGDDPEIIRDNNEILEYVDDYADDVDKERLKLFLRKIKIENIQNNL